MAISTELAPGHRTRLPEKPLNILFVSPHWPYKATCGTEIRAFHIRKALEQIGTVHVAVADADGRECAVLTNSEPLELVQELSVRSEARNGFLRKIRWALDPRIPFPHGTSVDSEAESKLLRSLQNYDLIWFNKLRTANMFSNWSWPHSVVDVDDLPSTYEGSKLQNAGGSGSHALAALRMMIWRRRERLIGERFSLLAVCSEKDRQYLRRMKVSNPIHVIPNGSERFAVEPVRNPAIPTRIGFVGLLEYQPNREGVAWFVKECWPRIKEQVPEARLRIAGKGSDGPLKPAGPDIDGLGWIPRLEEEIATWSLMIVPIRIGAGTRGKIAYGFSLKCPIVSTSLGAFGYEVQDGQDILLADTPDDFAASCVRAINKKLDVDGMTARAYQKFLQCWNWDTIAPKVWAAAEECLRMRVGFSIAAG